MDTTLKTNNLIEKEAIPGLNFGISDVLSDPQAKKKRMWDINRATMLGNGYQGKVDITFQTADGDHKRVNTTIWAFDKDYVLLKSGSAMPLRSIVHIEFY